MTNENANLFTRDDTFFGVCQGLGEDFGFNPNLLRIAIPITLFFWPAATILGYCAAGAAVFVARTLFPVPAHA